MAKRAKEARHVRLYHWFLRTEAWCDLTTTERAVYVELASRYAGPGSNNGRIPMSLSELATALHVSKQTAMRALDRLEDHGFVVETRRGGFNIKHRHAAEFRLTEFNCDLTGAAATKEFSRWRKSEHGSTTKPHRVSWRNVPGVLVEQEQEVNRPYGSTEAPVATADGSTGKPPLVYQGGAAALKRAAR